MEPFGVEASVNCIGSPAQADVAVKFAIGLLGLPGIIVSSENVQGTFPKVVMVTV